MATELLEEPIELEEVREVVKGKSVPAPARELEPGVQAQRTKSRWQEVFEGYEEFLGLTPD